MTTPRSDLYAGSEILGTAAVALAEWHGRETSSARSYVTAGHRAVELIDDVLRELHAVRQQLVGELRTDEIDRAARVDQLLAEIRAERAKGADLLRTLGGPANKGARFVRTPGEYSRDDDPVTNGPLPEGVEGRSLGGRQGGESA